MATGTKTLFLSLAILLPAVGLTSMEHPRAPGDFPNTSTADPGPANNVYGPAHPEVQALQNDLEAILRATGNRNGRWGVLAVSLDQHDTLLALNARQPMVPASNVKVLTTAAALHYLGPDFRYRTFLLASGPLDQAVLSGDLVLYGTGDPTLSERFFPSETAVLDSLARQIAHRGIREVRGDLVVDGSFFRGPELHPSWDPKDLNDAFAAPVAAVSLAENLVTVRVEAGSWIGAQPSIYTVPDAAGIPLENVARTVDPGRRSRVWLFREAPTDPIGIEGEIPLGGSDVWRELPVPDPLRFTGIQLERALSRHGVNLSGNLRIVRDPEASRITGNPTFVDGTTSAPPKILAVQSSPPLLEILTVVNKESNNFLAESVLKTVGRVATGDGSFEGGSRAVGRFLVGEVGVPPEQVQLRDGSGLSEENLISPGVFVQTLKYLSASPYWDVFLGTLPEAGVRRELRRMYSSPAAQNLRAKTGTMNGVSALSGMVRTRSGERILFSILANDLASEYRAKRAEDQLGIRLASLTRPWPS
ncbi:MAG: D-alanyl-D-alanine carboxypeptidase/D-alanyl-D-alanine-endopeptidase [Gemmatimonadota bacterium]|jgi:D-alanyl-D-alanine carboxypeptidase/D-alanyl-D-alanine-endopeptidase (penicillin-binding protein 4)